MNWDRLKIFNVVAKCGSLTIASQELNITQSAVSKQIMSLEKELGCILFHRYQRGLLLTHDGEILFTTTQKIADSLSLTTKRIHHNHDYVGGRLKLAITPGIGNIWLIPRLSRFFEKYPDVELDLFMTDKTLDFQENGADASLGILEPSKSDLIRKPLFDVAICLYAHENYIKSAQILESIEDISKHRVITYAPTAWESGYDVQWIFRTAITGKNTRFLTCNTYLGVLQAARNSLGVAVLPDYFALETDKLWPVFPELKSKPHTIFFSYTANLKGSKRIEAFLTFLNQEARAFIRNREKILYNPA